MEKSLDGCYCYGNLTSSCWTNRVLCNLTVYEKQLITQYISYQPMVHPFVSKLLCKSYVGYSFPYEIDYLLLCNRKQETHCSKLKALFTNFKTHFVN